MNKLIQDLGAGAFALTDLLEHQPIAGPPSLKGDVNALVTLLNTIYAPITGGAYVLKAGDTMTGKLIITQATANTSILTSTGYSLTGANAQSLLDLAGTWNTTGAPVGIRLSITDTASDSTSKFLEFLGGAGGATSVFSVDKSGIVTVLSAVYSPAAVIGGYFQASALLYLGTGAGTIKMTNSGAGILFLDDFGGGGFDRIQLGGTSAAFPAIKRSGTAVHFRLADDSAFAPISTANITQSTAALLSITSGANQRAGNLTLIGGTLTVANTSVTANSVIFLTRKTAGGTIGFAVTYTVIAATSFTVTSDNALDTSTYSYLIIEVP